MKLRSVVILKYLILLGVIFKLLILNAHGLWSDEALQFWVSKGINTKYLYSPVFVNLPDSVTLYTIFKNTNKFLIGSPFFTILLYFWSKFSSSVYWLRLLPCLFGIGILPLMYLIAVEVNFSKKWALILVAFCAWNASWFVYSAELRPYSLEIFCSALTLLFFLKIIKSNGLLIKYYIWIIFTIFLGIVSGYGYCLSVPFFLFFLILHAIFKCRDNILRVLYKLVILSVPVVFLLIYLTQIRVNWVKKFLIDGFHPPYLTYLHDYLHLGAASCILTFLREILQVISWQLFYVRGIFVNDVLLPAGIPFMLISFLFLIASVYFLLFVTVKKDKSTEKAAISVFLFLFIICLVLSIKGLAPFNPTRHNLFFSPALFISFFICVRKLYAFAKGKFRKNGVSILFFLLFIFIMLPNIIRDCQVAYSQEIRELLLKIQPSVENDDKVHIAMKNIDLAVLRYEYHYSNIPWIKRLKEEDISTETSFKASNCEKYDYQWYIYSHHRLSRGKAKELLNEAKLRLSKEFNFFVDLEYSLPPKVFGFRGRSCTFGCKNYR